MAIKCPDCGHWNDSELAFCEECGEPIDPKTRLMMELEGKKAPTRHTGARRDDYNESSSRKRVDDDDDDDYIAPSYQEEEKKKFPAGLLLILAGVAGLVYFLFLR